MEVKNEQGGSNETITATAKRQCFSTKKYTKSGLEGCWNNHSTMGSLFNLHLLRNSSIGKLQAKESLFVFKHTDFQNGGRMQRESSFKNSVIIRWCWLLHGVLLCVGNVQDSNWT